MHCKHWIQCKPKQRIQLQYRKLHSTAGTFCKSQKHYCFYFIRKIAVEIEMDYNSYFPQRTAMTGNVSECNGNPTFPTHGNDQE